MSTSTFWEHEREKKLQAQTELPVMQHLRAEAEDRKTRLLNGIAKLTDLWPTYDGPKRIGAVKTIFRLLAEFIDALANQHHPLPTTSIAICSNCRQVTLPAGPDCGTYRCRGCGALWFNHRASNFKALPFGFWDEAIPGDVVPKRLLSDEQQSQPGEAA